MTAIIQIFKSVDNIEKPDYNTAARQNVGLWDAFVSKTGFLTAETLFLPATHKEYPKLKKADLIVIQDIKNFDPHLLLTAPNSKQAANLLKKASLTHLLANNPQLKIFNSGEKPWLFEIFEFKKTDSESIEIWFKYADIIGYPKRENHKIATLTKGKTIRFKINGKHDFTLSARKQRTFTELDYVITHLGQAKNIDFKTENNITSNKTVPNANCKLIDERKILG